MKPNRLDLSTIHPDIHPKYSPNLHQFLSARNYRVTACYATAHRDSQGAMWLGYVHDGEFTGARMMRVLSHGKKAMVSTVINIGPLAEVPNFWSDYVAFGRCAIDVEHDIPFLGDKTRWKVEGDERSCLWCGKVHQRLERVTEVVVRERWKPVPASAIEHVGA